MGMPPVQCKHCPAKQLAKWWQCHEDQTLNGSCIENCEEADLGEEVWCELKQTDDDKELGSFFL